MARIDPSECSLNVCAFLDMLAVSEIGAAMLELSDDGYNVLVGSTPSHLMLFTSYADHPNKLDAKTNSTAAGRYQLLHRYWTPYQTMLGLDDFSPLSQDKVAIQQIRECRALPLIEAGNIAGAIARTSHIWASLPGAGYGQHENSLGTLQAAYQSAGGLIS